MTDTNKETVDQQDEVQLARRRVSFTQRVKEQYAVKWELFCIFILLSLLAWGVSALLLHKFEITAMPIRYALAFMVSYAVFYGAIYLWALSKDWKEKKAESSGFDFPDISSGAELGEGCLVALVAFVVIGILFFGSLALMGGVEALLEVVFEICFAGVVVRSLNKARTDKAGEVGAWKWRLFKATWFPASVILLVLCGLSWKIQEQHPQVKTVHEAYKIYKGKPK